MATDAKAMSEFEDENGLFIETKHTCSVPKLGIC